MNIKQLPDSNSRLMELEPFKEIKYIISDLDGTLLMSFDETLKRISKKIYYFRNKNIKFSIATGRSFTGAKKILETMPINKGTPIILYNGTVIVEYKTKEVIRSAKISEESYRAIRNMTEKLEVSAVAACFNKEKYLIYYQESTDCFESVYGWGKLKREKDYNGLTINRDCEVKEPTTIVLECEDIALKTLLVNKLEKIDDIYVTASSAKYIEIGPKGCDKGTALKTVVQRLQLEKNNILCIGDNDNDIPLFGEAGISIVVSNASPLAIEHAMYKCKNPSVQGVLDVFNVISDVIRFFGDS